MKNNHQTVDILSRYNINCKVQAPLEMLHYMTEQEIHDMYGNDGWEIISTD